MCLAVPAKIVELDGDRAVVDIDGLRLPVVVAFVENPRLGDHVLVHAGFAIRKWTEADLAEYRAVLDSLRRDRDETEAAIPAGGRRPPGGAKG